MSDDSLHQPSSRPHSRPMDRFPETGPAYPPLTDKERARWDLLTEREQEVTELIGKNVRPKAIAQRLRVSQATVGVHIANAANKLHPRRDKHATLRDYWTRLNIADPST